jgi:nicotinate-nucleotide adenylyltransferase
VVSREPIAILGGTFDPVHNAHLAMARRALEGLSARRILWIPTGTPEYRTPPVASAEDRVAMLKLAISGEPRYALDERELAPGASGYTFDTLTALRAELGSDTPLVMLIGSDQYEKLDTWHRWRELFDLCRFAVFARPGWKESAWIGPAEGVIHVAMAPVPVSASELRERVARGEDISPFVPEAVARYIRERRLYR